MAPLPDSHKRKVAACRRKFQEFYPGGFHDEDYVVMERLYKLEAHQAWVAALGEDELRSRLHAGEHDDVAREAVRIESRTNLLFSFEKMAVRDAVSSPGGAKCLAEGLHDWLYGDGSERARFERWRAVVADLPRRQTRVLTWPVLTVFGFIARPRANIFLKPMVTRRAAEAYGFDFTYRSRPDWETYESLLTFAKVLRRDLADWRPRDMIDIQSFIWVMGSSEYD
ncbi:MAG TPA: hypothetical protein VM030_01825 [Acidimicrobiales bacterium]|nr:hypothetical protein [Acidimicrobiales bacterium]